MKVTTTGIKDLIIIEPNVFGDDRGYFFETYNTQSWESITDKTPNFVQDNESLSHKGVLRGLHFQNPPYAQGKLVRVIKGAVLDVVVDIRKKSPTYGQWNSIVLSEENKTMFWVPPGFAHGFLTLENNTIFSYKCTQFYNKESEGSILWNDPILNIDWEIDEPILSEKDKIAPEFKNFISQFD